MTGENRVLIVDDDRVFCEVLAGALSKRGYEPYIATDPQTAVIMLEEKSPQRAIVDLRLAQHSGLNVIKALLERAPELKIVMLTGFASIATAVEAIKLGAIQYLTKPANADQILGAFDAISTEDVASLPTAAPSLDRIEWEHIQHVLNECDGNISAAAKQLGLHRRTLQRKLSKRPSGLS